MRTRAKHKHNRLPWVYHISSQGLNFIFSHETAKGVSNHLYWPGGSSGVTLGPGYDMGKRDKPAIVKDMQKIGLPIAVANKIAEASKLTESEADDFAHDNKNLVSLTHNQEEALLVLIVPHYESIVRRHINIHLSQHEYDALVSFVYNPGGSFLPIAHLLSHGKTSDAMNVIKSRNRTDGRVNNGLIHRRNDEVQLFLHGAYERHANKIQHRHK